MSALYALLFGLAVAVYGYLIGGVSFARLIAKHHGVDITAVGSHNPGGTNVWRTLGWKAGLSCMLLDMVKGFLAAFIPLMIVLFVPGLADAFGGMNFLGASHISIFACVGGFFAALGHSFPIYYRFRGGKNVMVTCGFLLAVSPILMLFGLICFLLALLFSHKVAIGSITAAVAVSAGGIVIAVITTLGLTGFQYLGMNLGGSHYFLFDWIALLVILSSCIFVVIRHRSNIQKIASGQSRKDF